MVSNMVYGGTGHVVKTVMVAGKILVRDGAVLAADGGAVHAEAQAQAGTVARQIVADRVHRGMTLLEAMEAGR